MRLANLRTAWLRAVSIGCALAVCPLGSAAQQVNTQSDIEEPQTERSTAADGAPLPTIQVNAAAKPKKKPLKSIAQKKPATATQGVGTGAENAIIDTGPNSAVSGVLFGQAPADIGTTIFDNTNIWLRSTGGGDANSFMRNLPNVQYQNDTETNAGVDGQKELDTRPLLLSINGGRTYENNFMLNGVSINTITGPVERAAGSLPSDENTPNADVVYGLHPQTVFVPIEFLETATVIDSNASAEYGNFQGGVVLYDLSKPPTDRYRASISYDRHTDEMVHYKLATLTGTNPLDRKAPTFEKNNLAVSLGAPITNELSFIAQASRKEAETTKQKEYTYFDGTVDEWSENSFYRGALALKTGIGRFTLDSSFTDYTQTWESIAWRDMTLDTDSQSSSTQLEYLASLSTFSAPSIGLGDVTLKSRAYYNNSDTSNYSNSDVAYARSGHKRRRVGGVWTDTFDSTEHDDWCRPDPINTLPATGTQSNTVCREGGYGDKEQGQTDIGLQAQVYGDLFLGRFKAGADVRSIEGRRARLSDFTYYTAFYTATGNTSNNAPPTGFNCPPGDPACSREQFANVKTVWRAFDIDETVNAATAFAELDQTWGLLNVRGGLRLDYEDYFENLSIAQRIV